MSAFVRNVVLAVVTAAWGNLLHSPAVHALTYLVGAGAVPGVCDYNSLQAAIDAAQSNPGEDFIRLSSDQAYNSSAFTIGQQDLTITGGYSDCAAALPPDAVPTGTTILNGAGGSTAAVMRIAGSGVRVLSNLQIRNGDSAACGGGIAFSGRGVLAVRNTGIAQNTATAGGGICFEATAAPAILSIETDVSINNNTATTGGGGGIWIGGPARLSMVSDRTLVAFNRAANDDGGGVHVRWPAQGDIGSPGLGNLGAIYANEARRGGGVAFVAADGSDGDRACVRLFSTASDRPIRLQDNRASSAGGGLYLASNSNTGISFAQVAALAIDFRIDGNTAPNGPAIFLDGDDPLLGVVSGSLMVLNEAPGGFGFCTSPPLSEIGRVPCTVATACNRIEGNRAQDLAGNPTNGNVIELQDDSSLYGTSATLVNNLGTRLISGSGGGSTFVSLRRIALVGNTLAQELYRGFNDDSLQLRDATIAGNAIGNSHVLRFDAEGFDSTLVNVLIDQPGKLSMARTGLSSFSNAWVLASDTTTLEPDPTVLPLIGSGRFVDPSRGDFRLRIGHEAVDYAPTPTGPGFESDNGDLDGRPRQVDLGAVSTNARIRDLGPYERQRGDPWLQNGNFDVDLRLWGLPEAPFTSFDGTRTAPGNPGGSAFINVPADQVGAVNRRSALVQCFNVPSSGEFNIVGQALTFGSFQTATQPILNWRVRYAGGDCSGAIDAQGDQLFGNGGGTWRSPLVPLTVNIDPARWTWNTTIEIRLDAQRNPGAATPTAIAARFDGIEVNKLTEAIFADGFEP